MGETVESVTKTVTAMIHAHHETKFTNTITTARKHMKDNTDQIEVDIATPKGVFNGSFSKTAKVSEVIEIVIKDQGLDGSDSFELAYNGSILKPTERPLVSFGIQSPAKMELIATGSGV
jgi:hypothetical protein